MPWSIKTITPPLTTPPSAYCCDIEHPSGYRASPVAIDVDARRTQYTIFYAPDGVTPAGTDRRAVPINYTNIGERPVTILVKVGGSEVARDVPKVKDGSGGGPRRGTPA